MLCVAAMGEVEDVVVSAVAEEVASCFGEPVTRMALPDPGYARDPLRNQYGAVPVLRALAAACPSGGRLLGVTGHDLFIPMLTFLYGQAQLGGRVAVISLARLRQEFYGLPPDEAVLLGRARVEALHEMGHVYGLVHCPHTHCAMALSTNIRQLDLKTASFCASCERRLAAGRGREYSA